MILFLLTDPETDSAEYSDLVSVSSYEGPPYLKRNTLAVETVIPEIVLSPMNTGDHVAGRDHGYSETEDDEPVQATTIVSPTLCEQINESSEDTDVIEIDPSVVPQLRDEVCNLTLAKLIHSKS